VEVGGLDVENALLPVHGHAARLLGDEREQRRLVRSAASRSGASDLKVRKIPRTERAMEVATRLPM
jgi:hypothetical protein